MSIIVNAHQIAEKSILDLNGKQTYLGNGYSTGTTLFNPTSTVETPILLIKNPTTSGTSMFMYNRRHSVISNNNGNATFRYYITPTITANGSIRVPQNQRINPSSPSSQMQIFQQPTVTSNGQELLGSSIDTTTTGNPYDNNILLILDPGATILVTVTSSTAANAAQAVMQCQWYELPCTSNVAI